jgi:hypothetical protein
MGKQRRNKTRLRPQEYDANETDDTDLFEKPDNEPEPIQAPEPRYVKPASPEIAAMYCEGMVVHVPDKRKINLDGAEYKTGTIVAMNGGEAWVLDTETVIHVAKLNELSK